MGTIPAMRTKRLMGWLAGGVVTLVVLHLLLHGFSAWFDRMPIAVGRWLDMNSESSVATWYNIMLLGLVAALAALAAIASAEPRTRLAWGTLAVLVMLLSIDEKVQIHEQLPDLLGMTRGDMVTHEWVIPGTIIAGLGGVVLLYLFQALERPVRRGLLVAGLVYAAGAIAVEAVTGLATRTLALDHPARAAFPVWEALEESLEMVGCILALGMIVDYLLRTGVLIVRPPETETRTPGNAVGAFYR